MSVKPTSVWGTPGSRRVKAHAIEEVHFGKAASSVICECSWRADATTPAEIERAFYLHRKEMGVSASMMMGIVFPLAH